MLLVWITVGLLFQYIYISRTSSKDPVYDMVTRPADTLKISMIMPLSMLLGMR